MLCGVIAFLFTVSGCAGSQVPLKVTESLVTVVSLAAGEEMERCISFSLGKAGSVFDESDNGKMLAVDGVTDAAVDCAEIKGAFSAAVCPVSGASQRDGA